MLDDAIVVPIYPTVAYEKLSVDATFYIMEGDTIVGEGSVVNIIPLSK